MKSIFNTENIFGTNFFGSNLLRIFKDIISSEIFEKIQENVRNEIVQNSNKLVDIDWIAFELKEFMGYFYETFYKNR